jgi:hypothetical protein
MPMSEEDEVFLEKSFQRTLIVCPPSFLLSTYLIDIDILLGYPYRCMAQNRGDMLCKSRILFACQEKRGGSSTRPKGRGETVYLPIIL